MEHELPMGRLWRPGVYNLAGSDVPGGLLPLRAGAERATTLGDATRVTTCNKIACHQAAARRPIWGAGIATTSVRPDAHAGHQLHRSLKYPAGKVIRLTDRQSTVGCGSLRLAPNSAARRVPFSARSPAKLGHASISRAAVLELGQCCRRTPFGDIADDCIAIGAGKVFL